MARFYFWHTLSALATSDTKGKWICIGHFVMSSVDSGTFVLLLLLKGQFTIAACDAIQVNSLNEKYLEELAIGTAL